MTTEAKAARIRSIHDIMASEFSCDRGLVMELAITELPDTEIQLLEKVIQGCQEARQIEVSKTEPQASAESEPNEMKVGAFFWSKPHTITDAQFHKAQHIHAVLIAEFCHDQGVVMNKVLAELFDEELQVMEKVLRRCQEARQIEAAQEMTAEDRMLETLQDLGA
ncbi:MAG: hypothetical protein MI924_36350 [Chloroflexales bacterium]|nr:hypothetical protein [Chloroflexales bacterium]